MGDNNSCNLSTKTRDMPLQALMSGSIASTVIWSLATLVTCVMVAWLIKIFRKSPNENEHLEEIEQKTTSAKRQNANSFPDVHLNHIPGKTQTTIKPVSVNYHFTRQCNYKCGFCFHTAKTSFVLPEDEAKRGLKLLKDAGMEKINFSGGEPFIHNRGKFLGELVKYCKEELRLPSVSIVSNGSLVKESWFQTYGSYLDILAISCDSFVPETNEIIGRQQGNKNHLDSLTKIREWCKNYKVAFKLNTVVNEYNKDEDMTSQINRLNPCRWKVFQCLLIGGENAGLDALRNAEPFVISNEEFQRFIQKHSNVKCLVPESNEKMRDSYLILDEYMRFLDCTADTKKPSRSILDVGVEHAINRSGFDEIMFHKRGGKYKWSKADIKLDW